MRTAASHCSTVGGANLRPRSDLSRDVHWLYIEKTKTGLIAPVEEFSSRPVVGSARIRVADVGGEEFDEAAAGVRAARGDQRRYDGIGCSQKYDREPVGGVVHPVFYSRSLMNDKGRYHT